MDLARTQRCWQVLLQRWSGLNVLERLRWPVKPGWQPYSPSAPAYPDSDDRDTPLIPHVIDVPQSLLQWSKAGTPIWGAHGDAICNPPICLYYSPNKDNPSVNSKRENQQLYQLLMDRTRSYAIVRVQCPVSDPAPIPIVLESSSNNARHANHARRPI